MTSCLNPKKVWHEQEVQVFFENRKEKSIAALKLDSSGEKLTDLKQLSLNAPLSPWEDFCLFSFSGYSVG